MKNSVVDKNYYDNSSYFDEAVEKFSDLENHFQRYRVSKVLQLYTPAKAEQVLDLGCGWGTFCFALAPLCKQVTGVDFSQKSIGLCHELLAKKGCHNITFVCAEAQATGLKSETYDVIVCADLVEHLYPEAYEAVLDECNRLLKKGGKLVIWTPHRGHILEILKNNNIILKKDISHVDYKSMQRLLDSLKKRAFFIRKNYYAESHIPLFCNLEKLLLSFLPIMRRRIAILAEKSK